MTKEEYIELIGENPEDMFGADWQNIIDRMFGDYRDQEVPEVPDNV